MAACVSTARRWWRGRFRPNDVVGSRRSFAPARIPCYLSFRYSRTWPPPSARPSPTHDHSSTGSPPMSASPTRSTSPNPSPSCIRSPIRPMSSPPTPPRPRSCCIRWSPSTCLPSTRLVRPHPPAEPGRTLRRLFRRWRRGLSPYYTRRNWIGFRLGEDSRYELLGDWRCFQAMSEDKTRSQDPELLEHYAKQQQSFDEVRRPMPSAAC